MDIVRAGDRYGGRVCVYVAIGRWLGGSPVRYMHDQYCLQISCAIVLRCGATRNKMARGFSGSVYCVVVLK